MRNFIFISPNFPETYWKFCKNLQMNGFKVLGIGDCPYNSLSSDVINSVNEYYWVSNLENYDEVYRAVAFFAFKYGEIEFIESNNEYWLERDARLRTAFNIKTGFQTKDVKKIKFKSQMKKYFNKAEIKTARFYVVKSLKGCEKFISEVGYPVIVKPDNGVGANDTRKIKNYSDLVQFFNEKPSVSYIMEEYIEGEVCTYDAIVNGDGESIFESGNITKVSLMDTVNDNGNCMFYILANPDPEVIDAGRRTVKAFGVKKRFVHFEYFRLTKNQPIGKKGEIVALEVNMRPSGGISPDMMNYANSTDVYKIWADMIAFDCSSLPLGEKFFCAYAGRRKGGNYALSDGDVREKYSRNLKLTGDVPEALSGAMGDEMYVASFKTEEEVNGFYGEVLKTN